MAMTCVAKSKAIGAITYRIESILSPHLAEGEQHSSKHGCEVTHEEIEHCCEGRGCLWETVIRKACRLNNSAGNFGFQHGAHLFTNTNASQDGLAGEHAPHIGAQSLGGVPELKVWTCRASISCLSGRRKYNYGACWRACST